MAPKQDKSKQTAKQKAVEDKTFGLKNKNKSKAVQQYVTQLKQSAQQGNANKAARIAAAAGQVNLKDKKKAEEERQKELNALFAVAIKQPKVPPGVDPKSIVCEFYRHGQCTKGFKCKFSHDLTVERKGPKIDLYTDQRDVGAGTSGNPEDEEQEGMADWDQETLERVVKEKHGNEKPSNATSIICKFFIEAVEKHQYGWFWKCPNGADCKYRHALPPDYVLKSQMKELLEEESRNQRDVAEQIEEERAKIEARTPITEDVFKAWRQRKVETRRAKRAAEEEERRRKGIMTGREIFLQEGFTVEDDAGASGADDLIRESQAEEEEAIRQMLEKAKDAAALARQRAIDEPSSIQRPAIEEEDEEGEEEEGDQGGGDEDEEEEEEDGEGQAGPSSRAGASGQAGPSTHLQLNDDDAELFEDDDDDDDEDIDDEELDALEAQLQGAAVQDSNGAGPSHAGASS